MLRNLDETRLEIMVGNCCTAKPSKRIKQLAKKRRQTAPKTKAEKQLATVKRKKLDAKRVLNMTEKKLAKHEGMDEQPTSVSEDLDFNAVQQISQTQDVIFAPNPGPQT